MISSKNVGIGRDYDIVPSETSSTFKMSAFFCVARMALSIFWHVITSFGSGSVQNLHSMMCSRRVGRVVRTWTVTVVEAGSGTSQGNAYAWLLDEVETQLGLMSSGHGRIRLRHHHRHHNKAYSMHCKYLHNTQVILK